MTIFELMIAAEISALSATVPGVADKANTANSLGKLARRDETARSTQSSAKSDDAYRAESKL
jgi:hypothetical protein